MSVEKRGRGWTEQERTAALHGWAGEDPGYQAAVMVLTRMAGGRMADEQWSWIVHDVTRQRWELDPQAMVYGLPGYLGYAERLAVALAASFAGTGRVQLDRLDRLTPADAAVAVEAMQTACTGRMHGTCG